MWLRKKKIQNGQFLECSRIAEDLTVQLQSLFRDAVSPHFSETLKIEQKVEVIQNGKKAYCQIVLRIRCTDRDASTLEPVVFVCCQEFLQKIESRYPVKIFYLDKPKRRESHV